MVDPSCCSRICCCRRAVDRYGKCPRQAALKPARGVTLRTVWACRNMLCESKILLQRSNIFVILNFQKKIENVISYNHYVCYFLLKWSKSQQINKFDSDIQNVYEVIIVFAWLKFVHMMCVMIFALLRSVLNSSSYFPISTNNVSIPFKDQISLSVHVCSIILNQVQEIMDEPTRANCVSWRFQRIAPTVKSRVILQHFHHTFSAGL